MLSFCITCQKSHCVCFKKLSRAEVQSVNLYMLIHLSLVIVSHTCSTVIVTVLSGWTSFYFKIFLKLLEGAGLVPRRVFCRNWYVYKAVGLLDRLLFILVWCSLLFGFGFPLTSTSKWFQWVLWFEYIIGVVRKTKVQLIFNGDCT